MLDEVLGDEGPLLHQPLMRRESGGLTESPDEKAGGHAASLAEFVDGRRVADSGDENFLGDAFLLRRETATPALDGRCVGISVDQMRHEQNRNFVHEQL